MRNAVIRKKLIKEQSVIRRFITHPMRVVISSPTVPVDLEKFKQRLIHLPY